MSRYKGSRFIVPNCNSGYDSNTQKCHRFSVPFEEEILLKSVKAILRKDFVMKGSMIVCEMHFLLEDIIWRRKVKDSGGNFIASVCLS